MCSSLSHIRKSFIYCFCFFFSTSFVQLVNFLSSLTRLFYFLGWLRQSGKWTLCLFGSLTSRWAGQLVLSLSISVSKNISVPLSPVGFDFDAINVNLQTQALPWLRHLGPTFSSVHHNCPHNNILWLGGWARLRPFLMSPSTPLSAS